jgi:hypothetical protein
MSISSNPAQLFRRAVVSTVLAAAIALVASPSDPAMASMVVHPAWLIALVLAARYGVRGLVGVPAVLLGVSFAELLAGQDGIATLASLQRSDALATLATIGVTAWIGHLHEGRKRVLEERAHDSDTRAGRAEIDVDALAEAALVLRERSERALGSLAFLADIAIAIDSEDPARAGEAVLELAMARTGARGGVIQMVDGSRLRTLASRGVWIFDHVLAPAVYRDRVAVAAVERQMAVAAHEVSDVRIDDSDLAAPLVDSDGRVLGVLALRGLAYSAIVSTAREDLISIARWAARSLSSSYRDAGPAAQARRGSTRAIV